MRSFRTLLAAGLFSTFAAPAMAESPPAVMTSIKPVHSLVASVMQGISEPGLIVEGAASPHSYALKPSQAARLSKATHVFWIGHALEAFLEKPIETVAAKAHTVELLEAKGIQTHEFRQGGTFDAHDHEDEHEQGEEGHEEHAQDDHADHADHADHDAHDDHHHDGIDPHIWLDPVNAIAMVREIARVLSTDDPANAERYAANAAATIADLEKLVDEVSTQLAPLHDTKYVVFHDAYRYFEERFGLHAAGSITISPEITPGAERIHEIRDRVKQLGATCVFAEPQFEPRLISVVLEDSDAKAGTIDPLGADLADGPGLYFNLIRNMASSMRDCLS
jgi:zinc transport system substrate-binding protein